MNHEEFNHWLRGFEARFPSKAEKLNEHPKREDVLTIWQNLLAGDYDEARAATEAVYSGEVEVSDKTPWDDYPRIIRGVINRQRHGGGSGGPKRVIYGPDGEPTYRCLQCHDEGRVKIVHPQTLKAARDDREKFLESGTVYGAMAACECDEGKRFESCCSPLSRFQLPILWPEMGPDCPHGGRPLREWVVASQQRSYQFTGDFRTPCAESEFT